MVDWEAFYKEGMSYHRTAQGSVRRPEVFTPGIIHNLAAMGIEKYIMALFMKKGMLPRNHTMTDLLEESGGILTLDDKTKETLLYMDGLQRICSMDDFSIQEPTKEDVTRFLTAIDTVASAVEAKLKGDDAEALSADGPADLK